MTMRCSYYMAATKKTIRKKLAPVVREIGAEKGFSDDAKVQPLVAQIEGGRHRQKPSLACWRAYE